MERRSRGRTRALRRGTRAVQAAGAWGESPQAFDSQIFVSQPKNYSVGLGLRATPLAQAASRVAADTASATRLSNMDGTMYSSFNSSGPTSPAMAEAAASFMDS